LRGRRLPLRARRPLPRSVRGRALLLAILLIALPPALRAAEARGAPADEGWIRLGTTLESEWAIRTGNARTQKLELTVEPRLQAALPFGLALTAIGRARDEVFDELDPGEPVTDAYAPHTEPATPGDRVEIELREMFLDGSLGRARFRVGRQQIVWGEADGLKVLDVVDPQDYREFILDGWDDSRIPLWSANVEVPLGPGSVQLLWIAEPTVSRIPGLDSSFVGAEEPFAPTAPAFRPRPPPQLANRIIATVLPAERPDWEFSHGDLGVRVASAIGGFDAALVYLYQYDDLPVLRYQNLGFAFPPPGNLLFVTVDVVPHYDRRSVAGGTLARSFGAWTVRSELACSFGRAKTLSAGATLPPPGPAESDEISYMVGVDWTGLRQTFLSVQFFQTVIFDHRSAMLREERDTNATFFVQRRLWNDRLRLEAMWLHGVHHADGLVRPKVVYELRQGLEGWLGIDWFYGSRNGSFGQYDDEDRAVVGLRWTL
jgi:hypothetical protein